jgi:hypothetical protein
MQEGGADHGTVVTTRPTRASQVVKEVLDVLHDLPAFLTAPLYRRWHQTWGATPVELADELPGDEYLPHSQFRSTRAISIAAPPDQVWPWLVQVGCGRAGWYSNDLLDNLGRSSATTILPNLQHLDVGQWVPMSPSATPTERTALKVHSFAVNEWLLWSKPDSTWVWRLTPDWTGGTRLITRVHAVYDWRHPIMAMAGAILMEFGDFAMQRRMLRGIKGRAEAMASRVALSAPDPDSSRRPSEDGPPQPTLNAACWGTDRRGRASAGQSAYSQSSARPSTSCPM